MATEIQLFPLSPKHFEDVIKLGNIVHGDNYLNTHDLQEMYQQGLVEDHNLSFVAYDKTTIVGFRITFAPNQWSIDKWCTPSGWQHPSNSVCYFKSIAIDDTYRGFGLGGKLLTASIEEAKKVGAEAGIAHLWRQSPGNSAVKYFTKAGGRLVNDHPDRWNQSHYGDGYICPVCADDCHCVAAEMILDFT